MNLSRKNIALIISLFLVTSSFAGCKSKQVVVTQDIKSVKVVQSTKGSIDLKTEYSSTLKPISEVSVAPKASGRVQGVNAVVGQRVNKGDVLFTIDNKEAVAQFNQSQASLASSNASLNRTMDASYQESINQYETTIQQKQLAYDDAKNTYDKNKTLYEQGVVTKQDFDTSETKLKTATIDLEAAKRNLETFKEKSNPQAVQVAAAAVAQSEKALELNKIQLDNYSVTSPISGTVSVKNVNEGELTSSSASAYTIINTDTLVAEVNVSDKMMAKLHVGDSIQFKVDAMGDKSFSGIINSISPTLDSKTQFYTVKINIDNSDGALKSGMFAKIYLTSEKKENVVLVDNNAIVIDSGVPFIYTVSDNVIKKKNVTTGVSNDKVTEVTANLTEGENIITEGQTFLSEGQKVNIKN